jgi:type I restriction enzyme S subunit
MEEWKEYKLKDICIKITDGSHSSPRGVDDGYPMFSVKDMQEYGFDYSKCKYVSNDDFLSLKQNDCVPQKGDVLVAKDGSYLKQIFVCKETRDEGILSSIAIFRPNNIVDSFFLCYLLKSPEVYNYIANNCVSGSALPRIVLKDFKEVKLRVPSLTKQKEIVSILKSLDDKIEANRKTNENLEQQAQALFKSWFVDFEPFKNGEFVESELGMIPKGWRVEKIGNLPINVTDYVANGSFASLKENVKLYQTPEYAYFIRNTDLKSGNYEVYVDKHSYEFLSKSTLYGGEVIISNVGDVGSVHLCPYLDKPMTLGNNIIMLKTDKQYYSFFLYILFKWAYGNDLIMSIKGGSAQPKFNKTDFKSLKIIVPNDVVLEEYHSIISSLFNKIRVLEDESRRLAEIRDTLLPKLMSGQIKVNEI